MISLNGKDAADDFGCDVFIVETHALNQIIHDGGLILSVIPAASPLWTIV